MWLISTHDQSTRVVAISHIRSLENVFKLIETDFSILEIVFMIHIQKVRCQQNSANLVYFSFRCEAATNSNDLFPHGFKNGVRILGIIFRIRELEAEKLPKSGIAKIGIHK